MLKIQLLGMLKIEYMGRRLDSQLGRKALAMLYLLLSSRHMSLPKSKLALYLWPDSSEDAARYNLRYNLWLIRKVIPADENGAHFILSEKDVCSVSDSYRFECDLLRIKNFCRDGADIKQLESALSCFQGEVMEGWYLKGCSEFNELILFDRMTCERIQMTLLHELERRYESEGMLHSAASLLSEMARIEPYNEDIALKIMALHSASGDRSAAINHYSRFKSALYESLGIAPNEALSNFCKELMSADAPGQIRAQSRTPQAESLHIEVFCLSGVNFFAVSDMISKALQKDARMLHRTLDRETVEDLAAINRELPAAWKKGGEERTCREAEIPEARIIMAAAAFAAHMASGRRMEIKFLNPEDMDELSQKTFRYIRSLGNENIEMVCPD